jgi:ribosomal protein S3
MLHEDLLIRNLVTNRLKRNGFSFGKLIINRNTKDTTVLLNIDSKSIYNKLLDKKLLLLGGAKSESAKLEKKTSYKRKKTIRLEMIKTEIEQVESLLSKMTNSNVKIQIRITKKMDALLVCKYIISKLNRRMQFRKIYKKLVQKFKKDSSIEGFKIQCAGRPQGRDMANIEWYKNGPTALHSYKSNVDYAFDKVLTKFGICGVKVWLLFAR